MKKITIDDLVEPMRMLRERLENLSFQDLPGIPIKDENSYELLPMSTSAVYFIWSPSLGLCYIGKASNIRSRWRTERHIFDAKIIAWERCHSKLRISIDSGDAILYWWSIPKEYLATVESVLLQIRRPLWNTVRV